MNIALIAHDKKKELMVQICIAYCGILSKHSIFATETTGKLVAEATGLKVHRFLSGAQGGDQQIGARIVYDEIDLVLFFRDPLTPGINEPDVHELIRLCDLHNVPIVSIPPAYHTKAIISPPMLRLLAFLSVMIPLDVDTIATPRPFITLGISSQFE